MSENMNETVVAQEVPATEPVKAAEKGNEFRFFKCCSASLKRFSVILFIINIFFSIILLGAGLLLVGVRIGFDMLSLLALPLITAFVILVIFARLISALIYGFAEIVEKHEKK